MTSETSRPQDGTADKRARLRENLLLFVGVPLGWGAFILVFYWVLTISEPLAMPGSSMMPTLWRGDYIMAQENYYQSVEPARGDLVVHRRPGRTAAELYIKRVVGLPGDEIQMIQGVLHINGAPVERLSNQNYAPARRGKSPRGIPSYVETLPGGRAYRIIEERGDKSRMDDTRPYEIPPDHYFVLGDNRDNSLDSRYYGPVPAEFMLHRPLFLFWSNDSARIGMRVD